MPVSSLQSASPGTSLPDRSGGGARGDGTMVKENPLMRRSASTLSMSQPENDSHPAHAGTDPDARPDAAVEPAAPLSGSSAHADADLTALIVAVPALATLKLVEPKR